MIKIRILTIIALFTAMASLHPATAQDGTAAPVQKSRDTLCAIYRFYPGDTLVYNLIAYDSLSINRGAFLWKMRNELWTVVCDSVSGDSLFHLNLSLTGFYSKESQQDTPSQERYNCPWMGRKVGITIDTVGNRKGFWLSDTLHTAINPGGPFQPYLFFPFGSSCNATKSSTITKYVDYVPENGLPVPLIDQGFMSRPERKLDTLGYSCVHIQLVQASQGNIVLSNDKTNIGSLNNTTSILNGQATLDISDVYHVPVHLFFTVEQKLTLHYPNNKTQTGIHYINSFYSLKEFRKSPLRK